jgi:D-sedoheptulose 7-phosphate isomerase
MNALAELVEQKARESARVQQAFFAAHARAIAACSDALSRAFEAGGRLWVMGNGGSACDAQHMAVEFMHPVLQKRRELPAMALGTDTALLSAVGNDDDFSVAYARQLRTLARRGDVAVGISTSGQSRNVLRALSAARELGLLTVGFTGRDGGRMGELCDHFFRVESFSIHRIQETHTLLFHVLWDLVHVARGEEDVL